MTIELVAIGIMLIGFLLRYVPFWISGTDLGVDHWYWKLYLETYWRERRFPPHLPQYLLEESQWYPPLFIMLVARLPRAVFERYSHLIGLVVDLLRLAMTMLLAGWVSKGDIMAVSVAGLVYATTPVMVSYNVQLNPRGLGALFLDIQVLLVLMLLSPVGGPWWLWGIVWLLGGLVLMTHKMTTQLMCFLALLGTIATGNLLVLAIIPASLVVALLISGGFYWKVLLAHLDIVAFWDRNWQWIMAHPVKESPVYGNSDFITPNRFYHPGFRGIMRHVRYFFAYNPWVWCLLPLPFLLPSLGELEWGYYVWSGATLLFGVMTLILPRLRCLGAGYLYIYNTAVPAALFWGMVLAIPSDPNLRVIGLSLALVGILVVSLVAVFYFYQNVKNSRTLKTDHDFEALLTWLSAADQGPVMCLPPQWYDLIAYRTGQPVMYGAHGYGFRKVEPVFPRILVPLGQLVRDYSLRYLVTMEGYLNERFISDLHYDGVREFGPYRLYELSPRKYNAVGKVC